MENRGSGMDKGRVQMVLKGNVGKRTSKISDPHTHTQYTYNTQHV
jgi:hypothetical protein